MIQVTIRVTNTMKDNINLSMVLSCIKNTFNSLEGATKIENISDAVKFLVEKTNISNKYFLSGTPCDEYESDRVTTYAEFPDNKSGKYNYICMNLDKSCDNLTFLLAGENDYIRDYNCS